MSRCAAGATVRVVLVDDDALVRRGLHLVLDGHPGITVVGEAADGLDGCSVVDRERPDVVLMDIRMPRCDGLRATELMLAEHPGLAVLVLTTFDADADVIGALRAGARGFLLKDAEPAELATAVLGAAQGRPALTATVLDRVMHLASRHAPLPDPRDRRAMASLTPREAEVAAAVARGLSNADIAADLFVSVATVKTHVSRVMEKLGAGSRVQVAAAVHRSGGTVRAPDPDGR